SILPLWSLPMTYPRRWSPLIEWLCWRTVKSTSRVRLLNLRLRTIQSFEVSVTPLSPTWLVAGIEKDYMKQSSVELSAGVFVLLGLIAIVWFSIQAGARIPIAGTTYSINARFSNVGGLKAGSQVFLAGVPVGRVEGIDLNSQFNAIVHMQMHKD